MALFTEEDFEERYLADMIDPIDNTYMISELAATISNGFEHAIAVMTSKTLKDTDLTDGKRFLPRFDHGEQPNVKHDPSSISRHKSAAAAAFGGG